MPLYLRAHLHTHVHYYSGELEGSSLSDYDSLEGVSNISVVERVNGYLGDDVGECDHEEGELNENQRVDESVETESEKGH